MCRPAAALAAKLAAQPQYDGQGDWFRMMRGIDADMRDLLKAWASGAIEPGAFFYKFDQILYDGHIGSHIIGQEQAGAMPSKGLARLVGREIADGESYFLRGFVEALISGKYVKDGEFQDKRAMARARLYQGKMRGTVGKGFTDGSSDSDQFLWVLGAVEEHCDDCPQLAAISTNNPFTKSTMFQHPGDGETPCLGNCKCHLVRVRDGVESQKPL